MTDTTANAPLDARGRPIATEGYLVQVWSSKEQRWMDYCRGTWPEARTFLARNPDRSKWRIVDWLLKEPINSAE
jgi:hypothetical protein